MRSLINIVCGKIISTFGKNGYLRILKLNFLNDYYKNIKKFYLDKEGVYFLKVENVIFKEDYLLVKFKDIDNIEEAEKILGYFLFNRISFKYLREDSFIYPIEEYKVEIFKLKSDFKKFKNLKLLYVEESKKRKFLNIAIDDEKLTIPVENYFLKIDNKKKIIYIKNLNEIF